jgi:hypothetical protein
MIRKEVVEGDINEDDVKKYEGGCGIRVFDEENKYKLEVK